MPFGGMLTIGGLGALGGIAGAFGKSQSGSATQSVQTSPLANWGQLGLDTQYGALQNYGNLVQQGPGANSISGATQNSNQLANLFGQYAQTGGLPSQQNIEAAQGYAGNIFAPQQQALNQSFVQAGIDESRQAGMLGRPVNDPTLMAKLDIGKANAQQQLSAQQTAFGNQYANQLQQNQLQYAGGQNQILNGLASQAFANQTALLGMGNQVGGMGLNYQLQTATRTGGQQQSGGGGLGGALEGGLTGLGAGFGAARMMGGFGGNTNYLTLGGGNGNDGNGLIVGNNANSASYGQGFANYGNG